MKKFLLFAMLIPAAAFADLQNIYDCNGIIQNRPCKPGARAKLLDLPKISKYQERDTYKEVRGDAPFARPRPEMFDEVPLKIEGSVLQPEATEDMFKEVYNQTEELRTAVSRGDINMGDAESKSIKLTVKLDTLCSRLDKVKKARAERDCEEAQDNLQAVALRIQEKRMSPGR